MDNRWPTIEDNKPSVMIRDKELPVIEKNGAPISRIAEKESPAVTRDKKPLVTRDNGVPIPIADKRVYLQ